jgi:hypothetical protein
VATVMTGRAASIGEIDVQPVLAKRSIKPPALTPLDRPLCRLVDQRAAPVRLRPTPNPPLNRANSPS